MKLPFSKKDNTVSISPILLPEAFDAFYEQTHLIVFRYIYGLHGGSTEDVEDLKTDA